MRDYLDKFEFTYKDVEFVAYIVADDTSDPPWKSYDGHGIISEWETRSKRPGEVIIAEDRRARLFYDVQATMPIAIRDGWGIGEKEQLALAKRLGREPKPGDIAAESVRLDCENMRKFCAGEWQYVGVCVARRDSEDDPYLSALWGIESNCADYIREVAEELADDLLASVENERKAADVFTFAVESGEE